MPVDDDDGVDRLPTRAAPGGTRTDTRLAPRESTSITKPLLTADESAEDDDVSDDEADLFEDPATVAEVPVLPADTTRISALRNANDVIRDDRSDDGDDDDDDVDSDEQDEGDDAGAERTVVSMVVPEHLLDKPSMGLPPMPAGDTLFDDADVVDAGDNVTEPFVPRPTEVVTTRLPARPTSTARPGWVLALMVFGGVVGAALIVIFIVAIVR